MQSTNFKYRSIPTWVAASIIVLALIGCSNANNGNSSASSSNDPEPDPEPKPELVATASVFASVNSTSGSTSKIFDFDSTVAFYDQAGNSLPAPESASYLWTLSDGQTSTEKTFSTRFDEEGIYTIELELTLPNDTVVTDDLSVTVFSEDTLGPSNLRFPSRYSDVNSDGLVNALDYLIAAQHAGGLREILQEEPLLSGDLNLDRNITTDDVSLMGLAVISGFDLPSTVFSDAPIRTLTRATLVSPVLLDPLADFELSVDGIDIEWISRNILGYAEFVVPEAVTGGREVELTIASASGTTQHVQFYLHEKVLLPAEPMLLVREYRDLLEELYPTVLENYREIYGDGTIVDIFAKVQASNIRAFTNLIDELEKQESKQQELVVAFMTANGLEAAVDKLRALTELRSQQNIASLSGKTGKLSSGSLGSLNSLTGIDICDVVDSVCAFRRFNEDYGDANSLMSDVCIIGSLAAALATGGWGAALGVFCVALDSGLIVNDVVNDLATDINFELRFTVTEKDPGKIFGLVPSILIQDGTGICRASGNQAVELAKSQVADKVADITEIVVKKKLRIKKIRRILDRLGSDGIQAFEDFIEDAIGSALPADALAEEVVNAFRPICDSFTALNDGSLAGYTDPLKLITLDQSKGNLLDNGDGSADFICGDFDLAGQPVGDVRVSVTKDLCNRIASRSDTLSCGGAEVTVTFGDNGSLLDDIFAVDLAGRSFSSNSPVRSTSGTVTLPSGSQHAVRMRGLAAPDGIGTYFISFTGASIVSGQASGSDLTPGVTKTFSILVD